MRCNAWTWSNPFPSLPTNTLYNTIPPKGGKRQIITSQRTDIIFNVSTWPTLAKTSCTCCSLTLRFHKRLNGLSGLNRVREKEKGEECLRLIKAKGKVKLEKGGRI